MSESPRIVVNYTFNADFGDRQTQQNEQEMQSHRSRNAVTRKSFHKDESVGEKKGRQFDVRDNSATSNKTFDKEIRAEKKRQSCAVTMNQRKSKSKFYVDGSSGREESDKET